jgi:peroxiredoxin
LIKEKGANLVAISGQIPDHSISMKEKNELEFEVLSDAHQAVTEQYTIVFKNAPEPVEVMKGMGVDFNSFYSDDSGNIPVPAVYVINRDGTVAFAGSKGGDYRERTEPAEVIKALTEI